MNVQTAHKIVLLQGVHLAICTFIAVDFNHAFEMVKDVFASHFALVETGAHFTVDVIPWYADMTAQKLLQRTQHISKLFFIVWITVRLGNAYALRLFVIIVIFYVAQTRAKLAVTLT